MRTAQRFPFLPAPNTTASTLMFMQATIEELRARRATIQAALAAVREQIAAEEAKEAKVRGLCWNRLCQLRRPIAVSFSGTMACH